MEGENIAEALFAHIIPAPPPSRLHKYLLTGSSFPCKNVFFAQKWIGLGVFVTFFVIKRRHINEYVCIKLLSQFLCHCCHGRLYLYLFYKKIFVTNWLFWWLEVVLVQLRREGGGSSVAWGGKVNVNCCLCLCWCCCSSRPLSVLFYFVPHSQAHSQAGSTML